MAAKKADPASIVSCATFPDAQEAFHLLIEGSGTDAPLTACMLRLHFVTLESYQSHNARAVGMVYAPYTDAEMLNWSTKGHADAIPDLVDCLTDLKTMLIQLRARLSKPSAADAEVYENTKKLMIEAAHASLANALITVTTWQEGFKNMANIPAYKAHKRTWNVIPTANTIEYVKHPFQTMLVVFTDMFARKMTSSTVKHTSLNTPSDVEKESIDDFAKIMDDASETILKKQLPTTAVLVDHLRASQMVLMSTRQPTTRTSSKTIASSSRPLELPSLLIWLLMLARLIVLVLRYISSTWTRLSSLPDTRRLRHLYLPCMFVLWPHWLQLLLLLALLAAAIAKAGAAAERAHVARPCFHCNKPGHTQPNCPQASTPVSMVITAKRKSAYIEDIPE
jgi:hypothetical protein